ncbi:uncharacterized protein [Apostichopus japonicus]|uniref:uncharacterized protein isoform X2 n=1 Tax=Stichopus japonicus TaxID=307972 RepID=UPI003AB23304
MNIELLSYILPNSFSVFSTTFPISIHLCILFIQNNIHLFNKSVCAVTQQTRDKFSPYGGHRKKKAVSLSFTFLCLCDRATMKVPSIFTQRTLTECGLGEKKVLIPSDSLPSEVMDVITRYYPKLREAGGFEYMKADGPSKRLHLIPIPEGGFTAANFKNVAKQAKIYLRPIQCDLELTTTTTTNTDENEVKIKCNNCNAMIPQTKLRSHVRSCRLPGQDARHICDYINIVDPDDGREENDEVLNAVIEESLLEVQDTSDQPSLDARLQESLENFQKAKMLEAPMIVVVRRRKVLRLCFQEKKRTTWVVQRGSFSVYSCNMYLTWASSRGRLHNYT